MAAPYVIPFNHQPVSKGVSTGTYTVPSGKYARVILSEAILPTLNGTALYNTKTITPQVSFTTASAAFPITANNVHRISLTKDNNNDFIYVNFCNITASASNYQFSVTGIGASGSFVFSSPVSLDFGQAVKQTSTGQMSSMTVDTCSIVEMWIIAADAIAFNSGRVYYEEYNIIS